MSLSVAAFLSNLGQYEIAIPVRIGADGEALDAEKPQHHRRRRRSAEDRLPDSVLCFKLHLVPVSYIYTHLQITAT